MSDVVTSTYSNSSTGVREMSDTIFEDVEGVIQNISPKDTPFQASIGSGKATNTDHKWLEDTLQSATGTNAAVEGADAVATTARAGAAVGWIDGGMWRLPVALADAAARHGADLRTDTAVTALTADAAGVSS